MSIVKTNSLTKYYGKNIGVKDVSFQVEEGEKFGFVGPNGAGKSTYIRLLLGMLQPTSGDISLFGKDIRTHSAEVRQKIGYIPADVNYYSSMNSRELLEYSAGFYHKVDTNRIDELAEYFELNLEKQFSELSTGNKKKTAIIQSLIHAPELLIMDEPTSGLDPLIKNKFFDLLEEQNRAGMTIFFSSHILSEIQRLCTKTVVIRSGEIVAVEDVGNLLKKQVKRCRVTFKETQEDQQLPECFSQIQWQDNKLMFEFHGDINELMEWISKRQLLDVAIEEPDLETIFMNYYKR